jgi:DNA-binding LytR/AlgR family response regulator
MKRFQFPLERVRQWRAGQATLEEMKLEQLRDQLAQLREAKRAMDAERAQSERDLLAQPSMQALELQSMEKYRVHTRTKILAIEERERQAEVVLEDQRQRLIRARRDAELLERLKRKALAAWQVASDREQESLATELFLAKRIRKR